MSWTKLQQKRLVIESEILKKYFRECQWINPNDSSQTQVEWKATTNSGKEYTLRVRVPEDYPNSQPVLLVVSPFPLRGHDGSKMTGLGVDHSMHTLSPVDGFVQVCHYRGWSPDLTLYRVFLKGRIWLEAYEGHLRTGNRIDDYLHHMK